MLIVSPSMRSCVRLQKYKPKQRKKKVMDSTITLEYWNVAARAQTAELILRAGNVVYARDFAESWPGTKIRKPFGQLPVLHHHGVQVAQSGAIARYCASLAKLFPVHPLERARCEQYMDFASEIFDKMAAAKYTSPSFVGWQNFRDWVLPQKLQYIEDGFESDFLCGASPTAADVAIFSTLNLVTRAGIEWRDKFPHIASMCEDVAKLGTIQEYMANPPPPYFVAEFEPEVTILEPRKSGAKSSPTPKLTKKERRALQKKREKEMAARASN